MPDPLPRYHLRPIRPADAEPVAALIRQAFAALPVAPDPPMSALRITAEDVTAHLASGGGALAAFQATPVASALWSAQDGGLYLGRLAVVPAWRGLGIARALIAAAEAAASELGLPRIHLSTRLVLTGNRRLFAACGFAETTQTAHPGYAEPTSVAMEKWLDRRGRPV
ncbi:MAG TPA: GNAT family N-acetyltransferase [Acetobacteraceae bacterium]|nr:GNAT family N-acetyltransferase [Acetobacteraceae bacterium]